MQKAARVMQNTPGFTLGSETRKKDGCKTGAPGAVGWYFFHNKQKAGKTNKNSQQFNFVWYTCVVKNKTCCDCMNVKTITILRNKKL